MLQNATPPPLGGGSMHFQHILWLRFRRRNSSTQLLKVRHFRQHGLDRLTTLVYHMQLPLLMFRHKNGRYIPGFVCLENANPPPLGGV
jgi:hypothetical protein